jgi:hypothetical protein
VASSGREEGERSSVFIEGGRGEERATGEGREVVGVFMVLSMALATSQGVNGESNGEGEMDVRGTGSSRHGRVLVPGRGQLPLEVAGCAGASRPGRGRGSAGWSLECRAGAGPWRRGRGSVPGGCATLGVVASGIGCGAHGRETRRGGERDGRVGPGCKREKRGRGKIG